MIFAKVIKQLTTTFYEAVVATKVGEKTREGGRGHGSPRPLSLLRPRHRLLENCHHLALLPRFHLYSHVLPGLLIRNRLHLPIPVHFLYRLPPLRFFSFQQLPQLILLPLGKNVTPRPRFRDLVRDSVI